jgi:hypothetical protein
LLGVNRPGTEYQCVEGGEFFQGPSDRASIEAMVSWDINAVRVPLNESCWLGINGVPANLSGAAYRDEIRAYVSRLESAGLYVILELQWAAPGDHEATGIIPLPDAEHAPDFWRSLATEYRDDRGVLFDLYNEPHDVSWKCWELGCEANDKYFGEYLAVGMQALVETVRSTGARQPLMLGGLNWASDRAAGSPTVPAIQPTPLSPRTTPITSPPVTGPAAPPWPELPSASQSSLASWGRGTAATPTSTPT